MNTSVPRRSVAKGALWAVPATVVVTAAPAFAASLPNPASCPGGVTRNWRNVIQWGSTQSAFTVGALNDTHTVVYTFKNEGTDVLPTSAFSGERVTIVVTVQFTGMGTGNPIFTISNELSVKTTVSYDKANQKATFTLYPTAQIPVNGTFGFTVKSTNATGATGKDSVTLTPAANNLCNRYMTTLDTKTTSDGKAWTNKK